MVKSQLLKMSSLTPNIFKLMFNIFGQSLGTYKPSGEMDECGKRATLEAIIGGNISQVGEFPYMALLGYQVNGKIQYGCGASLINRRYVLTAAHCHSTRNSISEVTRTFEST